MINNVSERTVALVYSSYINIVLNLVFTTVILLGSIQSTFAGQRNSVQSIDDTVTKTLAMDVGNSYEDSSSEFVVTNTSSISEDALPDLFTGTMKYRVKIDIPTGLNGLKPDIDLYYKSNKGNGWLGVGWDIPLSVIVQKTFAHEQPCITTPGSKTVCKPIVVSPTYALVDENGSNELVQNTDYSYSYKIENNNKRIIYTNSWEVTNTNGVKYIYGSSTKIIDETNEIMKWYLDKIVDTYGNYIKYNYITNKNITYLTSIEYSDNENKNSSPLFKIEFITEPRTDVISSYRYNVLEIMSNRLSTINIKANNVLIKSYRLNYFSDSTVPDSGKASVLNSVYEVAPDGTNLLTAKFDYTRTENKFVPWATASYGNGDPTRYFLADVNGDGRNDIIYIDPSSSPANIYVAKALETGFDDFRLWQTLGNGTPSQYRITDVNGDAKADLIYFHGVGESDLNDKLCLSNGTSFSNCSPVNPPLETDSSYKYVIADFSGDGNKDILHLDSTNGNINVSVLDGTDPITMYPYKNWFSYPANYFFANFNGDEKTDVSFVLQSSVRVDGIPTPKKYTIFYSGDIYVALSNGDSFKATDGNSSPQVNPSSFYWASFGDGYPITYRMADFNGDGKSDLVWIAPNGKLYTALSTGKKFVGSDGVTNTMTQDHYYGYILGGSAFGNQINGDKFDWGRLGQYFIETYCCKTHMTGDFNGDGKADILLIGDGVNGTYGNLYVALSTGSKFVSSNGNTDGDVSTNDYFWGALGDGTPTRYKIGDFNGDGKSDLMYVDSSGNISVSVSSGDFNSLLNHIETRQGGIIEIHYNSSTHYSNPQLPFALPVVSSITVDDGNPLKKSQHINKSTTSINYSGGYYSFNKKEFRGFSQVSVENPAGPNGEQGITVTSFHQGDNRSATIIDDTSVSDAYMRGKPYRIRTSNASGTGYIEQVINYADTIQSGHNSHFNPPSDITVNECLDAFTCKSSLTSFSYDIYGNVTRKEIKPDLNDATYNQTIERTFDPNTTSWIISLPSSETVYQGIGTITQKSKTEYFYDAAFDAASCTDTSYNTSPQKGKVTGIRYWLENGISPETRMAYDPFGNKICDRDAKLNITTYNYDPTFKIYMNEIVRPNNKIPSTKFTYYGVDATDSGLSGLFGQLKDIVDANGNKTTFQYDVFGRKIRTDFPDHTNEQIYYTDHSSAADIGVQNVLVVNPAGLQSFNYFDGMNKTFKVESTGAEGKIIVVDTVFDSRNKLYMTSYPYIKNQETQQWSATITRDYLGRVTSSFKPGKTGNVAVRNCYGLRNVDAIDENGHLIRKITNGLGLVAEVDEYAGTYADCLSISATPNAQTVYAYDILGRLTRVTDANQNVTSITYDTLGNKLTASDPDMGTWFYSYYPNGLVNTIRDAKKQVITYNYDELNRVISKQYTQGPGLTNTPDVFYSYDVDHYNDPNNTPNTPLGRLTMMTDSSGQTAYNYDQVGRITGKKMTIDNKLYSMSFSYLNGRLNNIKYPDLETVLYTYTGSGLQKIGSYVSYQNFDAFGRPWNAAYGTGGASTSLTYDPTTKRLDTLSTLSPTQGLLVYNEYGYDAKGNIANITDKLNANHPVNVANETYFPARAHALDHTLSGRVFQLDPNGNVINDGIRSITYNQENMPVLINSASNSSSFTYDGNGKRVKKNNTIYIDKYYECTDGACRKYIFAGNNRVAINSDGVKLYYHSDHLGSSAVISNDSGEKEESIAYYPFGGIREDVGVVINQNVGVVINLKHKFTGQELDSEAGLYNYGARLYDPELGRFMSPDSIVPNPENPQSMNRYSYALNNPINYFDPTGHQASQGFGNPIGNLATYQFGGSLTFGNYNSNHNETISSSNNSQSLTFRTAEPNNDSNFEKNAGRISAAGAILSAGLEIRGYSVLSDGAARGAALIGAIGFVKVSIDYYSGAPKSAEETVAFQREGAWTMGLTATGLLTGYWGVIYGPITTWGYYTDNQLRQMNDAQKYQYYNLDNYNQFSQSCYDAGNAQTYSNEDKKDRPYFTITPDDIGEITETD